MYKKGRLKIPLFFSLLFSFFNCFSQMDQTALLKQKLDSLFQTIFTPEAPGGSIFIQKGNAVLYSASFGMADLDRKIKYTEATVQNLGSISKTFVSYGILILCNEGKLSLDDNLLTYFPDFKNKEIAKKITIRHLLTHTSGLPDSREVEKDSVFYLTAKDAENWEPIKATEKLHFEPGSNYEYSNPAFNGLALIIEKVAKMKWQDFITQKIFIPSGMTESKITDGPYPDTGVAHGYIKNASGVWEEYDYGECPTFPAAGNGGVWSSINDLRKYVYAIRHHQFTDEKTIRVSEEPWHPASWAQTNPPYKGLAWFRHTSYSWNAASTDKDTVIEHSGSQGGFRTHLLMIPATDVTIIWLTNNEQNISKPVWNILKETGVVQ